MWKAYLGIGAAAVALGAGALIVSKRLRDGLGGLLGGIGDVLGAVGAGGKAIKDAQTAGAQTVEKGASFFVRLAERASGNAQVSPDGRVEGWTEFQQPRTDEDVVRLADLVAGMVANEADWHLVNLYERRAAENRAIRGRTGLGSVAETALQTAGIYRTLYARRGINPNA